MKIQYIKKIIWCIIKLEWESDIMIRAINIEKVESGMLLGQTVCDDNNRKLMLKDKELTDFSIEKLKELGFNFLYIENEIGEEFQNEDVISDELKKKMSDDLKRLDITSTIENAKSIVETVCDNYHNIFDTIDIRNSNDYLFKHSIMVAEFSIAIGIKLNLNQRELVNLATSALLHDIGKAIDFEMEGSHVQIGMDIAKKYNGQAVFNYKNNVFSLTICFFN